jgi:hypothetical protein
VVSTIGDCLGNQVHDLNERGLAAGAKFTDIFSHLQMIYHFHGAPDVGIFGDKLDLQYLSSAKTRFKTGSGVSLV